MTHDYPALIAKLSHHEEISLEAYEYVIDTLLFKIFDRDYIDEIESELIKSLPELINQPQLSIRYISPAFLAFLHQHPQHIKDFYVLLRSYLAAKIDNLAPLSVDEQFILTFIPELDEEQVMTLPITQELLDFAVKYPERLTNEQIHCLSLYLNAKVIDRQVLSPEESKIFDNLSSTIDVDNTLSAELSTGQSQADFAENSISPELAALEYGYDIYNFSDLIRRLETAEYQTRDYRISDHIREPLKRPLSMREIRVIKQAWGFDPNDETQRLAVLQPYWAAHDVLDPDGSHDRYVAGMQRYRERV